MFVIESMWFRMDSNTCIAAYVADYVVEASELVRSNCRFPPDVIDQLELANDSFSTHAKLSRNVSLRTPD